MFPQGSPATSSGAAGGGRNVAVVKLCAIETCGKPCKGRGRLCSAHYERQRLYGDPTASAPNRRPWRGQSCQVDGCDRPNCARGLCRLHAQRAYAHDGDPLAGRWTVAVPAGTEGVAPLEQRQAYDEPTEIDREPVERLRRELHAQRDAHVPFETAWPLAVARIGPALDPWREALDFALAEWRAAYLGEAPVTVRFLRHPSSGHPQTAPHKDVARQQHPGRASDQPQVASLAGRDVHLPVPLRPARRVRRGPHVASSRTGQLNVLPGPRCRSVIGRRGNGQELQ